MVVIWLVNIFCALAQKVYWWSQYDRIYWGWVNYVGCFCRCLSPFFFQVMVCVFAILLQVVFEPLYCMGTKSVLMDWRANLRIRMLLTFFFFCNVLFWSLRWFCWGLLVACCYNVCDTRDSWCDVCWDFQCEFQVCRCMCVIVMKHGVTPLLKICQISCWIISWC